MKNMSEVYVRMSNHDLLRLRSRKAMRIQKLESRCMGYIDEQEMRVLRQQTRWINAVIASREQQLNLFL